jgi:ribonuclease toxin BrnT of type II toxin-antitoxin system
MPLTFEWDPHKARTNLLKHGIAFEEAATIFGDSSSLTIADPERSAGGRALWPSIETRSLPTLTRSFPRHFTFYVADPVSSIAHCRAYR